MLKHKCKPHENGIHVQTTSSRVLIDEWRKADKDESIFVLSPRVTNRK